MNNTSRRSILAAAVGAAAAMLCTPLVKAFGGGQINEEQFSEVRVYDYALSAEEIAREYYGGGWHHIAVVYDDSGEARAYVDGKRHPVKIA